MSSLALTLVLLSAVAHALWNLLVKGSRDKIAYIWWMFVESLLLMALLTALLPGEMPPTPPRVWGLAIAGAGCFALYHLCNGLAYRLGGDLSLIYPLSQTSILWVPLWGLLLLGEHITALGAIGIALVAAGAGAIQLQRLTCAELLRPLANLRDPAVLAALAAGLVYSAGALCDKVGVTGYSPYYFTLLLVSLMTLFLSLNLLRPGFTRRLGEEWRLNRRRVLLAGPVLMGSFLPFRYGLQLAPMSYVVPVRQTSLVLAVAIGVLFLRESCGRIRLLAAGLILAGVLCLRLG
jgi:uncharacterized membrane protein